MEHQHHRDEDAAATRPVRNSRGNEANVLRGDALLDVCVACGGQLPLELELD